MKLKILDIVKNVGSEIIRNVIPGGSLIVSAVNALLPNINRLDQDATGLDIERAVNTLPSMQRDKLLEQQFDIDETWIKESASCLRTAIEADTKTPHTTRPKIAYGAFYIVAFIHIAVVSSWVYGAVMGQELIISTMMDGWPFILAMTGPFTTVLLAYFGILRKEHKKRLDAASGNSNSGNILSKLVNIFGK